MKLFRFNGALSSNSTCLCPRFFVPVKDSLYSTTATLTSSEQSVDNLYRRISPIGDPRVSIVPVLDQWIEEGRIAYKGQLENIVKELRRYRRFKHALEVSQWMSDKRYFQLTSRDMAVRLHLISKVHGIEQAENYFDNIPKQAKDKEVYCVLLNCYAQEKCLEKAEDVMQQMRILQLANSSLCYNAMLNLYHKTGNYSKLDSLMQEMEEKGIKCDHFTLSIRLTAYAATSDIEGMDKILERMESDPGVVLDWDTYSVAANGYMKAGLMDKALSMLKKSEKLISSSNKSTAFDFLLTQYAAIGNKDEVLRLWELYKNKERIQNKGYMSMISSLLKLDDIEGAEKVFEEWESSKLCYDFRIPNFLVGFYCSKGLMEKAEALVDKEKAKGGKPFTKTWYNLATGYVGVDQITKATEAMKVAISICRPGWKPSKEMLGACLEYLKRNGEIEEAEEFINSLHAKDIVSTDIHDKLLNYMKNTTSNSTALSLVKEDSLVGDRETAEQVDALVGNEEIHGIS